MLYSSTVKSTVLAFVVFMQVAKAHYEYDTINLFSFFW